MNGDELMTRNNNPSIGRVLKAGLYTIWIGFVNNILGPIFIYPTHEGQKSESPLAERFYEGALLLPIVLIIPSTLITTFLTMAIYQKINDVPTKFWLIGIFTLPVIAFITNSISALYELGREKLKNEKPPHPPDIEPA